ncbi:hypothetical protein V8G54_001784, partial [Vigna mungo]
SQIVTENTMKGNKPYLVVILIQAIYAAMFLLSKAAFDHGMNNFIFVFYRQIAATIFLIPFAFFFEWKTAPPLSFVAFCKIFFLSFLGITASLDIYGIALVYTSATLAAAITNCLPAITFFLALLLRIEVLKVKSASGIAKLAGVVACLTGAAILAFYKGPHLELLSHFNLLGYHKSQQHLGHVASSSWIKGCFLMLLSSTFWGMWLVLQTFVIKDYPSKLLLTTLQCFLSSIQSLGIALAVERDIEQWKLGWNVRLLAVVYWNYGDWSNILLTSLGYREERTSVSGHGNTTVSHNDHLLLHIYLGRNNNFGKHFRQHRFGYWTLLCAVGKEQRANAKSFLGFGGGIIDLESFTNHKLL